MMRFTLLDHMIMNYVLVLTLMSTLDSGPANQSVTTVIQDDIDIRDLTLEIWWLQNLRTSNSWIQLRRVRTLLSAKVA